MFHLPLGSAFWARAQVGCPLVSAPRAVVRTPMTRTQHDRCKAAHAYVEPDAHRGTRE